VIARRLPSVKIPCPRSGDGRNIRRILVDRHDLDDSTKITVARDLLRDREGDIVKGVPAAQRMNRVAIDELLTDLETEYQVKPHIPMLKEASSRKGFFEREQFDAVRAHLPEHVRIHHRLAYQE